jgi:hypothetical protein
MENNRISSESARQGHEAGPPSLRPVFIIAASVMAMMAVCLASTMILMQHYSKARPMQAMQPLGIITAPDNGPFTHTPSPNLELDDGHADFMALRQRQSEKLNSYEWVDRTNRIVRIPIERAIDLIALRGLPVATNSAGLAETIGLKPKQEGALP